MSHRTLVLSFLSLFAFPAAESGAHTGDCQTTSPVALTASSASILFAMAEPIETLSVLEEHSHDGIPPLYQFVGKIVVNGVVMCVFRCPAGNYIIEECP